MTTIWSADAVSALAGWLQINGPRLIVILLLWSVASQLVNRFGGKIVHLILTHEQHIFSRHRTTLSAGDIQRIETLTSIFIQALRAALGIIFGLMILSQVGIPVAPLFAGAGIVGLVLGFGAQSLVKDLTNGILIVFENQYSKGDRVQLGTAIGQVEEVSLRTTVLRDDAGVIYYIPNSTIAVVSNFSKKR